MNTLTPLIPNLNHQLAQSAQAIPGTATWVCIGNFILRGRRATLRGIVGAAAGITNLKLQAASTEGGDHQDLMVGSALASPTVAVPFFVGGTVSGSAMTVAANGTFDVGINGYYAEVSLWAQATTTATTVAVEGSAYPWPGR